MRLFLFLVLVVDALIVEALLPRWMLCGGVVMAAWLYWAVRRQVDDVAEIDTRRQGDGDVATAKAVEPGQAGLMSQTAT